VTTPVELIVVREEDFSFVPVLDQNIHGRSHLMSMGFDCIEIEDALDATNDQLIPSFDILTNDVNCKAGPLGDMYWCAVEGDWGLAVPEVKGGVVPFSNKPRASSISCMLLLVLCLTVEPIGPPAPFLVSILPPGWPDRERGSLAFISILVSALMTFWGPLEEVTTKV
jgi:hypothetical protein